VAQFSAQCQASYGNSCDTLVDFGASTPSEGSVDVPPIAADQSDTPAFTTSAYRADGVYLEDASGAIFDPVHDNTGFSDSSQVSGTEGLGGTGNPKPFVTLWAYFPAPSANVSSVTFVLPGGTPRISGVPIQATPPQQ
jgi:hypothetical protein